MKILIVNCHDLFGGAARAAYRLNKALNAQNSVQSLMVVQLKSGNNANVLQLYSDMEAQFRMRLDQIPLEKYKNRERSLFSGAYVEAPKLIEFINKYQPDIVHLHWIHGGMLQIEDLVKIQVPLIWTMHDSWSFTGGCHVPYSCLKYETECNDCPKLGSDEIQDSSYDVFKRKQNILEKLRDIVYIAPSNWLLQCANKSKLLKNNKVLCLPNPLNLELYKPADKQFSRHIWNLPHKKQLIMFGAMNTSAENKGFSKLLRALENIGNKNIEIVVFGNDKKLIELESYAVHYIGRLNDDISLVTLYSAVDVVVVPSLQENLSYVIMESLSCGTPVVCFNTGGNKDLIQHKKNGYLAQPYEVDDLSEGISWVLKNDNLLLGDYARKRCELLYDETVIAKAHIEIYSDVLKNKKNYSPTKSNLKSFQNNKNPVDLLTFSKEELTSLVLIFQDNIKLLEGQLNELDGAFAFSKKINKLWQQIKMLKQENQRIGIYGYGLFGKFLLSQLKQQVIVIFDLEIENNEQDMQVVHPNYITRYKIDLMVVSVLGREDEIIQSIDFPEEDIFVFDVSI